MAVRRASWWGWRLREPRQSLICIYCLRHWAFCGLELGSSLSGLIIPWASVQPNKPFLLCLEIGILYSYLGMGFSCLWLPSLDNFCSIQTIHPSNPPKTMTLNCFPFPTLTFFALSISSSHFKFFKSNG